jgi:phosphatidylinositol glycan class B
VAGVALSCGVDYLFYGELTFVPWNFVKFNVAHNISAFYGTHPFHWYLTQGNTTESSFPAPSVLDAVGGGGWTEQACLPS